MKTQSFIFSTFLMIAIIISSCGGGGSNESSKLKVESPTSKEVTIGNQVWMTKNLDVDKFRNGDPIPEAKSNEEWIAASENKQSAWCYYDNDPKNGEKYGKLYNWYAVIDSRGLAPKGYHVPSKEELTKLVDYLGENLAGLKLKSASGWDDCKSENLNGTNESGFFGQPGGFRNWDGGFFWIGSQGTWRSKTIEKLFVNSLPDMYSLKLICGKDEVLFWKEQMDKMGYSVRCIKD